MSFLKNLLFLTVETVKDFVEQVGQETRLDLPSQRLQNLDFQSNFSTPKIDWIFPIFFGEESETRTPT